jgi:hypothetical protein
MENDLLFFKIRIKNRRLKAEIVALGKAWLGKVVGEVTAQLANDP